MRLEMQTYFMSNGKFPLKEPYIQNIYFFNILKTLNF